MPSPLIRRPTDGDCSLDRGAIARSSARRWEASSPARSGGLDSALLSEPFDDLPDRRDRIRRHSRPRLGSAFVTAQALVLHGVTRRFGGLLAVSDVSLAVPQGARHGIIGPNGAGKTTLFNVISGELRATNGRIDLFGT